MTWWLIYAKPPPDVCGQAAEASELIVIALADLLTELRHQQGKLETRTKEALLAHPDGPIFQSLPCAGFVRAATLLAESGDRRPPLIKDPGPELDHDPLALLARPPALYPRPARSTHPPPARASQDQGLRRCG